MSQKQTEYGVFTSVIAAHFLFKTELGEHPLAQPNYNSVPANNLAVLETHKYWKKSAIVYGGVRYRGYKNWREFAIDFSDMIGWQDGYEDVLRKVTIEDQIQALSQREKNVAYFAMMIQLISDYGLAEFDHNARQSVQAYI